MGVAKRATLNSPSHSLENQGRLPKHTHFSEACIEGRSLYSMTWDSLMLTFFPRESTVGHAPVLFNQAT